MKVTLEFNPPRACFECKFVKYANNKLKHWCLIYGTQIKDYRYGARLEVCKQQEIQDKEATK